MLGNHIETFIENIKNGNIELYNEAGLQHELGYFLRCKNIQTKFEYNTNKIFRFDDEILKKELDLYIKEKDEQYCIELKFPNKGAYLRRMTQAIIDIFFLQQLVNNGFKKGYFLFITELSAFKNGNEIDGIYSYFRNSKPLREFCCQDIPQFMLDKEAKKLYSLIDLNKIELKGEYKIAFKNFDSYYYFLIIID